MKLPGPFDSYYSFCLWGALVFGAIVVVAMFLPIEFQVVDEAGNPVSGALVVLTDSNGKRVSSTLTQNGRTHVFGVWPGRYDIGVSADGYRRFDWTVDTSRIDHHLTGVKVTLQH